MMLKKVFTIFVVVCFFQIVPVPSVYSTSVHGRMQTPQNLRAQLINLGTGRDSRVEVKLRDGAIVQGYLSEVTNESFVVVSPSNRIATLIDFPDVQKVKAYSLSKGEKIAIGVVVGAGVALLIFWQWIEHAD